MSALFPRHREPGSGRWLTYNTDALGQTQRIVIWQKFPGARMGWGIVEPSLLQDFKNRLNPHGNALLVKNWEGGSSSHSPLKGYTPTEKLGAGWISDDTGKTHTGAKGCLGKMCSKCLPRNVSPRPCQTKGGVQGQLMAEHSSEESSLSLTVAEDFN